jgi:hypothetical protein
LNATHNHGDLRRAPTAILKWIRRQSLNDAFILHIPLSRGILIVLLIALCEEFSAGGAGKYAGGAYKQPQTASMILEKHCDCSPARSISGCSSAGILSNASRVMTHPFFKLTKDQREFAPSASYAFRCRNVSYERWLQLPYKRMRTALSADIAVPAFTPSARNQASIHPRFW